MRKRRRGRLGEIEAELIRGSRKMSAKVPVNRLVALAAMKRMGKKNGKANR